MWVWEVVEVVPITSLNIKPLGVTSMLLIMPCYASRRGLGECIHDRCEIVKLMVYLRWQLKYTSGWIEAPGYSSDCMFFFWTATQAQRDHEIIHARNFRVQPQAIMGSSIVD